MIRDKIQQQLDGSFARHAVATAKEEVIGNFATGDKKNLELLLKKYKATLQNQLTMPKSVADYSRVRHIKDLIFNVDNVLVQIIK